jgi:hypothetical protein
LGCRHTGDCIINRPKHIRMRPSIRIIPIGQFASNSLHECGVNVRGNAGMKSPNHSGQAPTNGPWRIRRYRLPRGVLSRSPLAPMARICKGPPNGTQALYDLFPRSLIHRLAARLSFPSPEAILNDRPDDVS